MTIFLKISICFLSSLGGAIVRRWLKAFRFWDFGRPPDDFFKMLNFVFIQNAPPPYSKKSGYWETPVSFTVCLRALYVEHYNTHKAVSLYLFKTPPPASKRSVPNFVFIQNALLLPQKSGYYLQGAHKLTKFCIYSKRPPPASKKSGYYHIRAHGMGKLCIFQNAPSYLKKSSYQILCLFKTPPFYFNEAVTTTKEPIKWSNIVFIHNTPPLLLQKKNTKLYSFQTMNGPTLPHHEFYWRDPLSLPHFIGGGPTLPHLCSISFFCSFIQFWKSKSKNHIFLWCTKTAPPSLPPTNSSSIAHKMTVNPLMNPHSHPPFIPPSSTGSVPYFQLTVSGYWRTPSG